MRTAGVTYVRLHSSPYMEKRRFSRGTSRIAICCARDQPEGVTVPHHNRTRVLVSGRFCLRPAMGCDRMCGDETTSSVAVGREMFVGKEVESER